MTGNVFAGRSEELNFYGSIRERGAVVDCGKMSSQVVRLVTLMDTTEFGFCARWRLIAIQRRSRYWNRMRKTVVFLLLFQRDVKLTEYLGEISIHST